MGDNGNDTKRRSAARCSNCGAIGIVQIWPDGRIQPLGQDQLCRCDDGELHVLEGSDRP
ncbi:hypothetical protein [Halosolutus gelatinilyticus]|uniref:hypothetical protein n=1 Tax=Halosolutus gelatinilyticus TaxID=2931975 RepID=UPI001FF30490|nr:hypothetical protein [Halosolutus gelatinilyticus]